MARPRMSAARMLASHQLRRTNLLTMNITLTLVRLSNEQIGDMASNMVLVTNSIAAEDFL
jgi:hypothetical protein